jgi:hypothetical protein
VANRENKREDKPGQMEKKETKSCNAVSNPELFSNALSQITSPFLHNILENVSK